MKILLLANGESVKFNFAEFDKIICVDGGLNDIPNGLVPNAIIGDFDSVDREKLEFYKKKTEIVFKNNQDESDLKFALRYCLSLKPKEIVISNAISGDRCDHSLCNILLLEEIPENISAKIITRTQEILLIHKRYDVIKKELKTISLIPLTNCKFVKTNGLKWNIDNDLSYGFIDGISNIVNSKFATISIQSGTLLCIIER